MSDVWSFLLAHPQLILGSLALLGCPVIVVVGCCEPSGWVHRGPENPYSAPPAPTVTPSTDDNAVTPLRVIAERADDPEQVAS